MTDLASLVLAVDSTQVKTGVASLDGLTAAGARAEAATIGLGRGSKTAGAAAAAMAANAQLASRAAVGMAGGATTASLAMASLGTKTHASSLQIRESLVLMREASVGNFTRMAGSASILAGSLATTGSNVGALAKQLLTMVGVLKVTQNAELAEAATQAAASAASVEAYAQRAAGAIAAADTELAMAEAAVRNAVTSEAEAAAQIELAAAHEAVAAAAAEAIIAEDALAVAQGRAAETAAASAAATFTSLGAIGVALATAVAIAAPLALAFEGVKQAADDIDPSAQHLISTLGLTDKEIKKLKDTTVTWGDVAKATFQVLAENAGINAKAISSFFSSAFHSIGEFGKFSVAVILAAFGGMVKGAADLIMNLPAVVGGGIAAAANLGIAALEKLVNLGIVGLNKLAGTINSVLGTNFSQITAISLGRIENNFGGTMKALGADVSSTFHRIFNETEGTFNAISQRASSLRDARIVAQANDLLSDSTNKAAKAHHDRAAAAKEEADAIDHLRLKILDLWHAQQKVDLDVHEPTHLQDINIEAILGNTPDLAKQLLGTLQAIADQAAVTGNILADAFGKAGEVFGGLLTSIAKYDVAQQQLADDVAKGTKTQAAAEMELDALRAQTIGNAIHGLKGLFKEHSAGYKAMEAIEKIYAIAQLARTIASIVPKIAAGAATMFSQLGVFAFPAVAAMVAVMAGLGFAVSGGGGSQKPPEIPTAGTGTILGDNTAQSQSIANSLEIMAKNSTKGLDYSSAMVSSLRKIESGIDNLAGAIARQLQLTGGAFDTALLGLGTKTSGGLGGPIGSVGGAMLGGGLAALGGVFGPVGFIVGGLLGGIIGGLLGGKKTQTKTLYDQGLQFDPATIQQIIEQGITGATYNVIQTITKKSGFLGIGGSTKTSYSTVTGPLDDDISRQTQLIIADLYKSVVDAAKVLGLDVADALKTFQVEIGKISFKDLKGDEITQALQAVFSKVADQMAGFAVSGLEQFQKAGEGLFETLMRLAKDYLTVDAALKSIGLTFGSVGVASVAARESLIELMGGLDQFVSQINYYYEHFLTAAEQTTFLQSQIDATFTSLGIAEPASIDAFKALVAGLDLTTDAGQATFAALMAIAPAFYTVATAAQAAADAAAAAAAQLLKQKQDLQVQLLQAQGDTAGATALQRSIVLATLDPSLVDLQKQVWAAQDAAAAAAKALALKNTQDQMQVQLLQAQGKAAAALALQRKLELAALDPTLRALQKQIYLAQDVATAKDNLLTAYKAESDTLQQTIDKFKDFSKSLREFRDSLFAADAGSLSYRQALTKLMTVGALAATGDETALGGVQDAAQKFLAIAEENAGSLQDVQRAKALVARYIDQAIGGADNQVSVAQQQLDQMKTQVGALIDINESVLTVAQAIQQLNAILAPGSSGGGSTAGAGGTTAPPPHVTRQHQTEVEKRLANIEAAVTAGALHGSATARLLDRATQGGDSVVVRTDTDTPVQTQIVA